MAWFGPTIEELSQRLTEEVGGSEPTSELVDAFRRRGRKDGRKLRDYTPVREHVVDAVDLACEQIALEYVETRQSLENQLAEAQIKARYEPTVKDFPPSQEANEDAGTDPLSQSVAVLRKRKREAAIAERARIERALRESAEEAERLAASLREQIQNMPSIFLQRVESSHAAGSVVWSGYTIGYEEGQSKRRSPDDEIVGPDPDINFTVPQSLLKQRDEERPWDG